MTVQTFYKNSSQPPQAGDEFIKACWKEIPSGFELIMMRGFFGK